MKIFNSIVQIIAVIGISIAIYLFVINKSQDEMYNTVLKYNLELDSIINNNEASIFILQDSIELQDEIIRSKDLSIASLESYIVNNAKETEKKLEKLSSLSLEDVLPYILSYYETDSTEAEIIMDENGLRVIVKPRLIYEWSYTITKLESRNTELLAYKKVVDDYQVMTEAFKKKISIMTQADSLRIDSMDKEKEKNSGLQNLLDNRNKKIKSIIMQRNIVAGIVVVVIVIALI